MESFETMSDAFSVCRERGRPLIVTVKGKEWKIFPSGRAEPRNAAAVRSQQEDAAASEDGYGTGIDCDGRRLKYCLPCPGEALEATGRTGSKSQTSLNTGEKSCQPLSCQTSSS